MNTTLYNLVVEVTRRCNMRCSHCLRGEPQNKAMKHKHLINFLKQVDYISDVTFTGGEPTLPSGIKAIYDFMDVCRMFRVSVGSFYMVTNAKVWRPEIPRLIVDLYHFCDNNEVSGVDISIDQFHDSIALQRSAFRRRLNDILWAEIGEDMVKDRLEIEYENVLEQGRGRQYNSGAEYNPEPPTIETYNNEIQIMDGEVYLNCNGNVVWGCDWSYLDQDKPENIICHSSRNFVNALQRKYGPIEMEV